MHELPFDQPIQGVDENGTEYTLRRDSTATRQEVFIAWPTEFQGTKVKRHRHGGRLWTFKHPVTHHVIELDVL